MSVCSAPEPACRASLKWRPSAASIRLRRLRSCLRFMAESVERQITCGVGQHCITGDPGSARQAHMRRRVNQLEHGGRARRIKIARIRHE